MLSSSPFGSSLLLVDDFDMNRIKKEKKKKKKRKEELRNERGEKRTLRVLHAICYLFK
jgi:hypothetical protein